jgi:hypothetical protein
VLLMAWPLFKSVSGFSPRILSSRTRLVPSKNLVTRLSNPLVRLFSSSYTVDSDEDSEQHLADATIAGLTADTMIADSYDGRREGKAHAGNRYDDLLESVGLSNQLKSVASLPVLRSLSNNDVFCNRELKLRGIRAIGFDMDYTLAQYKQPAFDRLAFDGAKAKLVEKLGYPEEVLNFDYDHTKWTRGLIIDTQVR